MKRLPKYVLDSYSLISYVEGEKGAQKVSDIIKQGLIDKAEIFMSVINWGEIYYIVLREQGKEIASLYLKTINRYPIKIIDADKSLTLEAANFKAFHKMSYADAFAAALAKVQKAKLVTGDKEFKTVESDIRIVWI
ncbi:tRNA(fMet)-specific endonuclease VapC [bacterium BMS3Abin04]|nr:tRNA(fMet)-specific endonuclease VapC [bacterium BMS3Abin04]